MARCTGDVSRAPKERALRQLRTCCLPSAQREAGDSLFFPGIRGQRGPFPKHRWSGAGGTAEPRCKGVYVHTEPEKPWVSPGGSSHACWSPSNSLWRPGGCPENPESPRANNAKTDRTAGRNRQLYNRSRRLHYPVWWTQLCVLLHIHTLPLMSLCWERGPLGRGLGVNDVIRVISPNLMAPVSL